VTPDRRAWWQRLGRRVVASRPGSWLLSRTLHRVDQPLLSISGVRISIPRTFAGLPVVRLTTTGAKTGVDRTVPLVGFREGEEWVLIASNWGRDEHRRGTTTCGPTRGDDRSDEKVPLPPVRKESTTP